MKKYFLLLFILVACFHVGLELNDALDYRVDTNSSALSHNIHSDDAVELNAIDTGVVHNNSQIIFESRPIFPQENYFQIWKPPVIH